MHSHFSDGVWSVAQLIKEASKRQLSGLSITDHDVLNAYPEAFDLGREHGLSLISGIELSSDFEQTSVHVLGYSFDIHNHELNQELIAFKSARDARIEAILTRLSKRSIAITVEALQARYPQGLLGRAHIADYMVHHFQMPSLQYVFDHYLGDQHIGSLRLQQLSTERAISLIHHAGGFAVLAHPHQIKSKRKCRQLLKLPFDGLEAYCGNLPETHAQPWIEHCKTHNKWWTGGSDFHQPSTYLFLGRSFTNWDTFSVLQERHNLMNGSIQ